MDKQLYYRIMVPASLLSVCLFFVPNFPIRSVIGFLVMFGGMGLGQQLGAFGEMIQEVTQMIPYLTVTELTKEVLDKKIKNQSF
ncbi:hypothetical protein EfmAA96_16680 [Enterococcus faecium]|nr:hypothetical protein EfmAA96_16680 [Enterococcus faecium]